MKAAELLYQVQIKGTRSFFLIQMVHFSHIIIDEAGQATEPEAFVSIKTLADLKTNIVLSRDPKQLGPIIYSGIFHPSWVGIKLH